MSDLHVSVVVTTCSRRDQVQRAVASVLAQDYGNFDVHIVDDASADGTEQALQSVVSADERVFYWRHAERRGLSAARNTGISQSTGDYLAFLDDDDEWTPDCLRKRVDLLTSLTAADREQLGVVYCGCQIHFVAEGRTAYNMPRITGDIRQGICSVDLHTVPSSCLFPRTVLEHIGGYDETLVSSVDHDIWMNLAAHGYQAFAVPEPLVISSETNKRRSMITDVTPRIRGVEQYLTKWSGTFEQWFGPAGGRRYVRRYRTHVLGGLSGRKLGEGDFRNMWRLARHVAVRNHWAVPDLIRLILVMGQRVARAWLPTPIVKGLKRILKPERTCTLSPAGE